MQDLEKAVVDYTLKLHIICAIKNIVAIICFTILAVVFNKWWIVLFSGLFLNSVEHKSKK